MEHLKLLRGTFKATSVSYQCNMVSSERYTLSRDKHFETSTVINWSKTPTMVCDKTPACGRFAPFDYQCCWINNLLNDHDLDSSSSSISGVPVARPQISQPSDTSLVSYD